MKRIVARNIGIIVGLSVLFSAVVTGCGDKNVTYDATSSETSISKFISDKSINIDTSTSVEETVAEVPAKLRGFVTYYADGSVYESEEYDKEGNLVKVGDNTLSTSINEAGNQVITRYIDDGLSTVTEIAPNGLVVREVDAWGGESTYTYNEKGLLVEEVTPVNGYVKYSYDSKDRLSNIDYVGTGFYWDYRYDSDGTRIGNYYEGKILICEEVQKTDGNGNILFEQRDETILADNSWDGQAHFSSTKISYEYTNEGKIAQIQTEALDEDSHSYQVSSLESYEYDSKGNPVKNTEKFGNVEYKTTYENEYDEFGRLASVVTYADDILSMSTFYSYYEED